MSNLEIAIHYLLDFVLKRARTADIHLLCVFACWISVRECLTRLLFWHCFFFGFIGAPSFLAQHFLVFWHGLRHLFSMYFPLSQICCDLEGLRAPQYMSFVLFSESKGTLWKCPFWLLITTIWTGTQAITTDSKCSARISNWKLSCWMCWAPRNHIENTRLHMFSTHIQVKTTHATCSAIISKWKQHFQCSQTNQQCI